MINKTRVRKNITCIKRKLVGLTGYDRLLYLNELQRNIYLLKNADYLQSDNLPTLGKLRLVLEQELKQEKSAVTNNMSASENDWKRLALKSAVYDYYMNLPYPPETIAVDYQGDLTARRDDKDVDKTDVDLAPNKNTIYSMWMEKLAKLIRENKISDVEFDEAANRGTPQGGAFEKQLDRYRQEFMKKLWHDYEKYYKQGE